jgi:hypothetical protein
MTLRARHLLNRGDHLPGDGGVWLVMQGMLLVLAQTHLDWLFVA